MATVTVSDLADYLSQFEPNTPLILRDPSRYPMESLPEGFVSLETALYEMGATAED